MGISLSIQDELEELKKQIDLRVNISGPSSWVIRGLIEDVDEYVISSLDMLIGENLPNDLEYEILEDKNLCSIDSREPDCEDTLVIAIYRVEEKDPIAYIVYDRIIGDNTYEFRLRKIILKQT